MKYKKIPVFTGYEISKEGIIKTIKTGKIKSQYIGSTGYYMVTLAINKKQKPQRVHRLIAQTYIPNPLGDPTINHIDGNKINNDISNLEWCTHLENVRHAFRIGLVNNTGVNNGMSKLDDNKVMEIKRLLSIGDKSQESIAKEFNISRTIISKIKQKKYWKHI